MARGRLGRDDPRTAATGGDAGRDLSAALDPWQIVASRTALGGAAPGEVRRMAAEADAEAARLAGEARHWRDTYRAAEDALLEAARKEGAQEGAPS